MPCRDAQLTQDAPALHVAAIQAPKNPPGPEKLLPFPTNFFQKSPVKMYSGAIEGKDPVAEYAEQCCRKAMAEFLESLFKPTAPKREPYIIVHPRDLEAVKRFFGVPKRLLEASK